MSRINIIGLVLGGIALAGIVWYSFLREEPVSLVVTKDLTTATDADRDVVNVLLQLRAVSLAGTIFTDPAFMALQDYGRQIVPEPVGRSNPFAPLGSNAGAPTSASTTKMTPQPAR